VRLGVAALALVAAGCAPMAGPGPVSAGAGQPVAPAVDAVVDGDTIRVRGIGTVRLLGIDTPETRHPERGEECFGPEASARTAELLPPGEPVRLTYDQERRDRYDRTLAYVERAGDGLFVNGDLVRTGHARAREYPPNTARAMELGATYFRALPPDPHGLDGNGDGVACELPSADRCGAGREARRGRGWRR